MNMPLVLLNRRRRGGSFSPYSLFSSTAIGLWLDPSDLSTMFSDRAGTTPVTAPGTVVGLRLDKSKGLALGSELVVNGTFDGGTTTGWASSSLLPSTATVTSGEFVVSAASASGRQVSAITCVVGLSYKVTGSARVSTGTGSALISISDSTEGLSDRAQAVTTNATATSLTLVFRATQTTHYVTLGNSGSGTGDKTFDNISVRELAGNHAVAPTDAARPIYGVEPKGGRRNLVIWSEDYSNAAWGKTAVTVSATQYTAPDGTVTADLIYPSSSGTGRYIVREPIALTNGATCNTSIRFKAAGIGFAYVTSVQGNATLYVNLTTGATSIVGANISNVASSIDANNWVTVSFSSTLTVGANGSLYCGPCDASGSTQVTASGTNGILIWGAQLELGSTATNYQRVTTAYDITESGVATCHYVQYDGSDDSMSTAAIDFTATDKMSVFAGVRKLSDAAVIIAELGTDFNSQAGSMLLANGTPVGSGPNYCSGSRGTAAASTGQIGNSAASFAAPITSLVTALHDIAGDLSAIRVNGVASGTNATGDKGAGNFGNHSLFFGRRNNATAPFNGRDFGIIVVGKAASAGEITDTETWLAAKTAQVTL